MCVAYDALFATTVNGSLENVSIVEVLHRLRAQVDAQMLELCALTHLGLFKAEHVEDANETVGRVTHRIVERHHRLLMARVSADGRRMLAIHLGLIVHRLVGVGAERAGAEPVLNARVQECKHQLCHY